MIDYHCVHQAPLSNLWHHALIEEGLRLKAPFVAENRSELERLKSLVERLSPEDYARELGFGWTVGMAFAHLAYWDQFAVIVHERWQKQGFVPIATGEADLINDAALPMFRLLPWNVLKEEVVAAAERADHAASLVGSELAAQVIAGGRDRLINRYVHRRMHLDDIERALSRRD